MMTTVFSGCDTLCFFDKKYIGECMETRFSKNKLTAVFAVRSGMQSFLYKRDYMPFHLISVSEYGGKGLIYGQCKIKDWELILSVDELNIEVCVDFDSEITKIIGHLSSDELEQDEINRIYLELKTRNAHTGNI